MEHSSISEFWVGTVYKGIGYIKAALYGDGVVLEVAGRTRAVIVVDGGVLKKITKKCTKIKNQKNSLI